MIADVAVYLVEHFNASGIRRELRIAEQKRDHAKCMYLQFDENGDDWDYWDNYYLGCEVALDLLQFYPKPRTPAIRESAKELRERVDLLDVAGRYTKLRKNGDEYMGKCPLHASNDGENFEVNTTKQLWHCFSCQKGGDVFKLVMEVEKMDFPETCNFLRSNFV
jgi:hypothetical protein